MVTAVAAPSPSATRCARPMSRPAILSGSAGCHRRRRAAAPEPACPEPPKISTDSGCPMVRSPHIHEATFCSLRFVA
ncbi:protein of unknown function [Streptomyces sp. KY75]|nr:protein of unknown function [Streptomyces sp. KY75]